MITAPTTEMRMIAHRGNGRGFSVVMCPYIVIVLVAMSRVTLYYSKNAVPNTVTD
jgi:hypothetical protein